MVRAPVRRAYDGRMSDHLPRIPARAVVTALRVRATASAGTKPGDTAARVAHLVGANLREARRKQGHSLDSLAAISGVSRAMLGQIETAKSVPTITVLWKIATALGVPLDQLVGEPEEPEIVVAQATDDAVSDARPVVVRSIADEVGGLPFAFEAISIAPGHASPIPAERFGGHVLLVIAAGEVTLNAQETSPTRLRAGDAVRLASSAEHSVSNSGAISARLFLVRGTPRR
jgi:transcriptional regulator with XRE-family HTH domain